jgi:hypothetical protein
MPQVLRLGFCVWFALVTTYSATATSEPTPVTPPAPSATFPSVLGALLMQEAIQGAPFDAAAYRILYRSTGLDGQPIIVSGLIVIPVAQRRTVAPIVAWAHPTTGVVELCAPSLALFHFQQIQGLRDMVSHGFIVAATDYPGLGTPGPRPYLVGVSEARAVLDSVRAARALPAADAGRRFTVWGHSQGGQAALFGGMIAASLCARVATGRHRGGGGETGDLVAGRSRYPGRQKSDRDDALVVGADLPRAHAESGDAGRHSGDQSTSLGVHRVSGATPHDPWRGISSPSGILRRVSRGRGWRP